MPGLLSLLSIGLWPRSWSHGFMSLSPALGSVQLRAWSLLQILYLPPFATPPFVLDLSQINIKKNFKKIFEKYSCLLQRSNTWARPFPWIHCWWRIITLTSEPCVSNCILVVYRRSVGYGAKCINMRSQMYRKKERKKERDRKSVV